MARLFALKEGTTEDYIPVKCNSDGELLIEEQAPLDLSAVEAALAELQSAVDTANDRLKIDIDTLIAGEDQALDQQRVGKGRNYAYSASVQVDLTQSQTVYVQLPNGYSYLRWFIEQPAQDGVTIQPVGEIAQGQYKIALADAQTKAVAASSGYTPIGVQAVYAPFIKLTNTYAGANSVNLHVCMTAS